MKKYECTYKYTAIVVAPDKESAKVLFLDHLTGDFDEAVVQRVEETIECKEVQDR